MMDATVAFAEKCPVIKCENQSEDEQVITICDTNMELLGGADYLKRNKQARQDPTSHRIIEKRRRDRMNNCLADLSRLIPPDYLKKGRGRIEKTEIIEMATKYIKHLQSKRNVQNSEPDSSLADHFRRGYQECLTEAIRYLVEKQGYASDAVCAQFINHLQRHCTKINNGTKIKDMLVTGAIICVGLTDKGGDLNAKRQSKRDGGQQMNPSNHVSHNPQFMLNHDRQHVGESELVNSKDGTRHKHSNSFSDEKSYDYSIDNEQSQSKLVNRGNISPEENVMGLRTSFPEQNLSSNKNNYTSIDMTNNIEEEEGNKRINIIRSVIYGDREDYMSSQDTRNESLFSPVYLQNNAENSLRSVRKHDSAPGENGNFNVEMDGHSYKFKNTIKQRFSQSQSTGHMSLSSSDGLTNLGSSSSYDPSPPRANQSHGSVKFNVKRRKLSEHHNRYNTCDSYDQSSSGTNSSEQSNGKHTSSTYKHNKSVDSKDSLLENSIKCDGLSMTKLNANGGNKYEERFSCSSLPGGVPIFALHAKGSFYIPLNVDYESLVPFLGAHDLLDITPLHSNISLHPVTINVSFQPTLMNSKICLENIRTVTDKKSW